MLYRGETLEAPVRQGQACDASRSLFAWPQLKLLDGGYSVT